MTNGEAIDYKAIEKTLNALRLRARQFRQARNYDLAIKTYQEIIPLIKSKRWFDNDINRERTWIAECYLLKGDEDAAREMYRQAIREDAQGRTRTDYPAYVYIDGTNTAYNNGADWFAYSVLLNRSGREEEAKTLYNDALISLKNQTDSIFVPDALTGTEDKHRQEAMMYLAAGIAYCDREMYDCASYFLEIAREQLPESALANYYYGQLWNALYTRDRIPYANRDKVKTAYTRAAALAHGELKVAAEGLLDKLRNATQEERRKANVKTAEPPAER